MPVSSHAPDGTQTSVINRRIWTFLLVGTCPAIVGVTAVAALAKPVDVIAGLGVCAFAIAVTRRPVVGLVGLFVVEPFYGAIFTYFHDHRHVPFGPLTVAKDALIFGLLVRAVLVRALERRDVRLPRSQADRFMVGYIGCYCLIAAGSPNLKQALYGLGRVVEGPILMLAIIYLRPSREQLMMSAKALVGAASVMGAAAVIESIGPKAGFQTWYGAPLPLHSSAFYGVNGTQYRSGSFLDSPLTLAFYLAVAGPFAIALAGATTRRWRPLALGAVGLCYAGLVVTVTRSGYIGGFLGAVVVMARSIRNPTRRSALLGMLLVSTISVVVVYVSAGNETLLRSPENVEHASALQSDVAAIVDRPLGYGLGTTDYLAQRFQGPSKGTTESEFLAKAVEGGIGGLLLYLTALFVMTMRLRRVRIAGVRTHDPVQVTLAAGGLGAIAGLAGSSLFLGIEELVVEVAVWGAIGIAIAYAEGWHIAAGVAPPVGSEPVGTAG